MEGKTMNNENLINNDILIEEIHKMTGLDEHVIGCCLSNYGIKHQCSASMNGYCKDLSKCQWINNIASLIDINITFRHKYLDDYYCNITDMLDKEAKLNTDSFFKHYVMIDKHSHEIKCLPIRVPGGTVGGIWYDDEYRITKIVIDTNYVVKSYPENINDIMQKYIGIKLLIENMEENQK
jgi:hypothetical protein